MMIWLHIYGMVLFFPLGCTQAEKCYLLETVLSHLPHVVETSNSMDVKVFLPGLLNKAKIGVNI